MTPTVQPFFHADSSTWTYVVADPASGEAAIVDPVLDFDPKAARTSTTSAGAVLAHVRGHGLRVAWILETHAHADHLSAGHWLRQHLPDARLAIGEGIRQVQKTFRPIFNLGEHFPVDGSQFDHLFADDERFMVGGIQARVIAVPGHTSDSVAYLIGDALFVGDSLFMPDGGTARCDFPGGDAATLYRSIQRLYTLSDDTRVFVCHDYAPGGREVRCQTTLGEQKRGNIHIREGVSEAEFVAMRTARDATLAMPTLILPAVQVNIRAGALPPPEDNGVRYLKLPIDRL
ncbi:MBL fold metallo-hydrolase [Rehaibacterium terrae]|jgi:glyoxylase-like metal-dependent hydrolase (beta-lactamase superfamily II)|uniref:Glyoxylase-like metal-dependent hydrolase (Beta-lactamase superfamily II) n=1 Tax=Rehaibacterium terrae TaxID=1341696 RepID=A0A7W8DFA4_9GAMM|nr:MBL fold metallo-hydrolase [Rehaibacterium terrae]MBB5016069.1 glyoxylase-like metal-dependent hydrolase (beta-lactamase superfamily II) [Rehaibacterium terrae]